VDPPTVGYSVTLPRPLEWNPDIKIWPNNFKQVLTFDEAKKVYIKDTFGMGSPAGREVFNKLKEQSLPVKKHVPNSPYHSESDSGFWKKLCLIMMSVPLLLYVCVVAYHYRRAFPKAGSPKAKDHLEYDIEEGRRISREENNEHLQDQIGKLRRKLDKEDVKIES